MAAEAGTRSVLSPRIRGDEANLRRAAQPLRGAHRAEWDAHAITVGIDPAEYRTKQDLIAAVRAEAKRASLIKPEPRTFAADGVHAVQTGAGGVSVSHARPRSVRRSPRPEPGPVRVARVARPRERRARPGRSRARSPGRKAADDPEPADPVAPPRTGGGGMRRLLRLLGKPRSALVCPRCGATGHDIVYGFGSLQPTVAMCWPCWKRLRRLDRALQRSRRRAA